MKKNIDKVKGALYGVAVGDALGAPLEFMSATEIKAKHGGIVRDMLAGGWLDVVSGEITDDTQMTLAVAKGIIDNPDNPVPKVGQYFIKWYDSQPKDIGNTCRAAIATAKRNGVKSREGWLNVGATVAEQNGHRSGGNGALMRTVYTGLFYDGENCTKHTRDIASMTHDDAISNDICTKYAAMIQNCVQGDIGTAKTEAARWLDENKMTEKPSGWVKDSMNCALTSLAKTRNFEDAVVRAVNLGGDADTIGAITGGLAGAIYGFAAIPDRWINALSPEVRQQLDELAMAACR